MMIDNDYSKNKTLLPDFGLGVIQKASYRVVPFSKSKDTREIKTNDKKKTLLYESFMRVSGLTFI